MRTDSIGQDPAQVTLRSHLEEKAFAE